MLGITGMGGVYYSVQGYLPLEDDEPFILAIGGVLIEETLYLNLTGAQKHTDSSSRDTEVMHIELDRASMNGTFYSIGRDFNLNDAGPSPKFDSRFIAGTLTLTGSILNLSSNIATSTILLPDE